MQPAFVPENIFLDCIQVTQHTHVHTQMHTDTQTHTHTHIHTPDISTHGHVYTYTPNVFILLYRNHNLTPLLMKDIFPVPLKETLNLRMSSSLTQLVQMSRCSMDWTWRSRWAKQWHWWDPVGVARAQSSSYCSGSITLKEDR